MYFVSSQSSSYFGPKENLPHESCEIAIGYPSPFNGTIKFQKMISLSEEENSRSDKLRQIRQTILVVVPELADLKYQGLSNLDKVFVWRTSSFGCPQETKSARENSQKMWVEQLVESISLFSTTWNSDRIGRRSICASDSSRADRASSIGDCQWLEKCSSRF